MKEAKPSIRATWSIKEITRITPFGAFVQLSPSVEALVHVSEASDEDSIDPDRTLPIERKDVQSARY